MIEIKLSTCCATCNTAFKSAGRANTTMYCTLHKKLVPMYCVCEDHTLSKDIFRLKVRMKKLGLMKLDPL